MRTARGFVLTAWASLLAVGLAAPVRAQLFVVSGAGEPRAVEHAELAYAVGSGPPVTWLSLRLRRGPVAVVVALPEGAALRPGLDAWFSALEATASPNVLPPKSEGACLGAASFAHVSWLRDDSAPASELIVDTAEDVLLALEEQGLTLAAGLPSAASYAVWSWSELGEQTTRTLRVEGGALPLALAPSADFPVLLSALTRGPKDYAAALDTNELTITFVAEKRARSDYRERLSEWLGARPEPLLEMRAQGPLFDWALYDDVLSLAPLVQSYPQRAKSELPELDVKDCAAALSAWRTRAAPDTSACGGALDAGLALSAAGPDLATLQRFAVWGKAGVDPSALRGGGEPQRPLLRAQRMAGDDCNTVPLPPIMPQPPRAGGGSEPRPRPAPAVVVEETLIVEEHQPVEVSCWGSPGAQTEQDDHYDDSVDCSSDTSSSSDSSSSDADCSSDTSGSSDSSSSDADCSSDSSGSSDSGSDSGCGSDSSSSSSSSSDTSCDGGPGEESSGYDGDTCTASGAPRAERGEKAQAGLTKGQRRPARQRLKTSLWSVGLAAMLLPIRRRKRR